MDQITPLTNQEKSARRIETMNELAVTIAKENKLFQEFLESKGGDKPTWRQFETFLKRAFESGKKINVVVESASGD